MAREDKVSTLDQSAVRTVLLEPHGSSEPAAVLRTRQVLEGPKKRGNKELLHYRKKE